MAATAVTWFAGDVSAKAEATDVLPGASTPANVVEPGQAPATERFSAAETPHPFLSATAVPSLTHLTTAANQALGSAVVMSDRVGSITKPAADAVTSAAAAARHTVAAAFTGTAPHELPDTLREITGTGTPVGAMAVTTPATTVPAGALQRGADDLTTLADPVSRHKRVDGPGSRVSHLHDPGDSEGTTAPSWPLTSTCGSLTNATAGGTGGNAGVGDVPDRLTGDILASPTWCAMARYAVQAVMTQPDVTPG